MSLRAGQWVEVRSRSEILATLDEGGRLDGMPFMPEMLQYCGKRFRVWKRAHKTCDTVNRTGGRRVASAVHLEELRCDGQAHGGCQAACLLFWKEAWLRRVPAAAPHPQESSAVDESGDRLASAPCTEERLQRATRLAGQCDDQSDESDPTYSCQATLLPSFTTPLPWWDMRQYVEDYTSGNVPLRRLVAGAIYACYSATVRRVARVSGKLAYLLVVLYDRSLGLFGGAPYPRRTGEIPAGRPTPSRQLGLEPGEMVRVRPYRQILATLDVHNKNRGLYFDAEEVPHCGKAFRVRSVVTKIIDERTGKMLILKDRNVLLHDAWCQARYSDRRMLCPRAIYAIWRETWLDRVTEPAAIPKE